MIATLKRYYGIVAALVLLNACSGGPPDPTPQIFLQSVSFKIDAQANNNTAVPVDVVVAYDPDLLKELTEMSAVVYFTKKPQLIRDNPQKMDVFEWQVVPGQPLTPQPITLSGSVPYGGLVFANYLSPGDHRIRLGAQTAITVDLGKTDFNLQV